MDGETNGSQEATQGAQGQTQEQQQEGTQAQQEVTGDGTEWDKQIADRDARITELERQVAKAAKNAETAESLRGEIAELKAQLAGVRNVKAARAILANHDNDIDKLKETEPWLFEDDGKHAKGSSGGTGTTGLPNAGAATEEGKTLKHWREIAGLNDDEKKE